MLEAAESESSEEDEVHFDFDFFFDNEIIDSDSDDECELYEREPGIFFSLFFLRLDLSFLSFTDPDEETELSEYDRCLDFDTPLLTSCLSILKSSSS